MQAPHLVQEVSTEMVVPEEERMPALVAEVGLPLVEMVHGAPTVVLR